MPDIVAGTSIGAVVGGCHAAGQLDELEGFARDLTRRSIFGYLDFNLPDPALINGQQACATVSSGHLDERPYRGAGDPRFIAVATEIGSGPRDLAVARPARRRDARLLCAAGHLPAGEYQRPLAVRRRARQSGPVSVCRALGARYVIAVNLNSDICGRGTVVPDAGSRAGTAEELPEPKGMLKARTAAACEVCCKRQVFGTGDSEPRHLDRDGRCIQYRAGSHRALAPCRRSARRHDQPALGWTWGCSISTAPTS